MPVKPAQDEAGQVMIQLHKSSGKNANNPNNVFIVELVYIEAQVYLFLFLFPASSQLPYFRLNQWDNQGLYQ